MGGALLSFVGSCDFSSHSELVPKRSSDISDDYSSGSCSEGTDEEEYDVTLEHDLNEGEGLTSDHSNGSVKDSGSDDGLEEFMVSEKEKDKTGEKASKELTGKLWFFSHMHC